MITIGAFVFKHKEDMLPVEQEAAPVEYNPIWYSFALFPLCGPGHCQQMGTRPQSKVGAQLQIHPHDAWLDVGPHRPARLRWHHRVKDTHKTTSHGG